MNIPIWITNFKNYAQAVGDNALILAKIHEKVAQETGQNIAIAVNPIDLFRVKNEVSIPVFSQKIDNFELGAKTGWVIAETVKMARLDGTMINHSEHRQAENVEDLIEKSRTNNLINIVCAENPQEVSDFAKFKPNFIAYEPPELIGSKDISVATKPECISESVKLAQNIPLIVGAGISTEEDVKISIKLGAKGFLVASAICKSENPAEILKKLVLAMGGV